jgi:uncharacterized protein (TIGR02996 family)
VTDEVFLHEILTDPEDDAPRLVYADWLDDQGGGEQAERAEFIRLQCELARAPLDEPGRPEREVRLANLLEEHEPAWLGPLAGRVSGWHFRRGFIEAVELEAADLLAHGAALFAAAPIRHVRLTDLPWTRFGSRQPRDGPSLPPSIADLAACPLLDRLTTLDLSPVHLRDEDVATLVCSPHLSRLRGLSLAGHQLTERAVVSLARSPLAGRLTALSLGGNQLSNAGAAALAEAPLAGLQALGLSGCGIGGEGLAALAEAPWLGRLSVLALAANPFPESALLRLLAARALGRLTHLNIARFDGPRLGGATLRALAVHPRLDRLTRLQVDGNTLLAEALPDLVASPAVPALKALGLGRLELRESHLRRLLPALAARGGRGHTALTALGLEGNLLGGAGFRALAGSAALADLVALDLRNTGARDADVLRLAGSPYLQRLAALDLSGTSLGLSAARQLAELSTLPVLSTLWLSNATDRAVQWALTTSPRLPLLRQISIRFTWDGGRTALEPWWAFPTFVPFRREASRD